MRLTDDNNQIRLYIADDGVGMDKVTPSDSSFGYKLVNTLIDQLEGTMDVNYENGTHITIFINEYQIAA